MLALEIAKTNLKIFFRNLQQNSVLLIIPIAFIAVFGFVYGKAGTDLSFTVEYIDNEAPVYKTIIDTLVNLKNGDGKDVFYVTKVDDREKAIENLQKNKYTALIEWEDGRLKLTGDTQSPMFNATSGSIATITDQIMGVQSSTVKITGLSEKREEITSGFQLIAPGLIIYGLLIFMPHIAETMAKITEKKEIFRYFTSKARGRDIIFGNLLFYLVLSVGQTILLFMTAKAFGFTAAGSILPAIPIALLTSLFTVGLGLLFGALCKDPSTAANLGNITMILLGFMSGSFIIGLRELVKLGKIGGYEIALTDLVPSSHATEAMKQVLLYGRSLGSVKTEMIILTVTSVVIIALGMLVYNKKQLSSIK